jgi:hypothetical protein
MRYVVAVLLVLCAHFSMTANVPTAAGRAWIGRLSATKSRLPMNPGGDVDQITRTLAPLAASWAKGLPKHLRAGLVPTDSVHRAS